MIWPNSEQHYSDIKTRDTFPGYRHDQYLKTRDKSPGFRNNQNLSDFETRDKSPGYRSDQYLSDFKTRDMPQGYRSDQLYGNFKTKDQFTIEELAIETITSKNVQMEVLIGQTFSTSLINITNTPAQIKRKNGYN